MNSQPKWTGNKKDPSSYVRLILCSGNVDLLSAWNFMLDVCDVNFLP